MLVSVYSEAAYSANGDSFEGIEVELDLADYDHVPTVQDIHVLMAEETLSRLKIDTNDLYEHQEVIIIEGTDPQWEWFEDEDPSNWTITQAWEFDQEVQRVDSSLMEEFGLFITNYCNVHTQGASGLAATFHDSYVGAYSSGEDYARETYIETCDKPEALSQWPYTCIDWEAAWEELEVGGDNSAYELRNGDVAIFNNHF